MPTNTEINAHDHDPARTRNLAEGLATELPATLVQLYECQPLSCPRCGEPMRIIAFICEPFSRIRWQEVRLVGKVGAV
ncbi:hypothetical protein GF314_02610 [bacterium]|nr:hypothetical protein [bacterium]